MFLYVFYNNIIRDDVFLLKKSIELKFLDFESLKFMLKI